MIETITGIDYLSLIGYITAIILIVVGLAGTVVPALPGQPMIFVGAWLVAWLGDYVHVGSITLIILGVLTVIGLAVDWIAQTMGAQRAGATKYGIIGSMIGTFVGLFLGIVGILFMPLVGAFLGEFFAHRDLRLATNVGVATWMGMVIGTAVKLGLSFVMVGLLVAALLV